VGKFLRKGSSAANCLRSQVYACSYAQMKTDQSQDRVAVAENLKKKIFDLRDMMTRKDDKIGRPRSRTYFGCLGDLLSAVNKKTCT